MIITKPYVTSINIHSNKHKTFFLYVDVQISFAFDRKKRAIYLGWYLFGGEKEKAFSACYIRWTHHVTLSVGFHIMKIWLLFLRQFVTSTLTLKLGTVLFHFRGIFLYSVFYVCAIASRRNFRNDFLIKHYFWV